MEVIFALLVLIMLLASPFLAWNFLFSTKARWAREERKSKKTLDEFNARQAADREIYSAPGYVPVPQNEIKPEYLTTEQRIARLKAVSQSLTERPIIQQNIYEPSERIVYGHINPMLVCPHCQNKGKVRNKTIEMTTVTKKNVGLGGFALGGKDVSKRMANTFKCDNCGTTWEV